MLMRRNTRLKILKFLEESLCDSVTVVGEGKEYRLDFNDGKSAFIKKDDGEIIKLVMNDGDTVITVDSIPGYKGAIHEISSRLRNLDTTMKRSLGVYDRKKLETAIDNN